MEYISEYRITRKPITIGVLFNHEYEDLRNLLASIGDSKLLIHELLLFCNGIPNHDKITEIIIGSPVNIRVNISIINLGAAAGRNWLIKNCFTKYILFCDVDTILVKNTITVLYDTFEYYTERHNNIYGIVPKMYYAGTNQIWFYGKYNKHYHNTVYKGFYDIGKDTKVVFGNMITTCVLVNINEFTFNKLWFDEEFFIYHEDISTTAFRKNIYCLFQPNALAYHNVELNIKTFDKFRHYLMFRNGIIMGIKRFDIIGLIILFKGNIALKLQPIKLKIRAILYGLKIGLTKLFGLFNGKIIDINEFKFVQKLSKYRAILR